MTKMTPPIKDLLPRLTPILKNRFVEYFVVSDTSRHVVGQPTCVLVLIASKQPTLFSLVVVDFGIALSFSVPPPLSASGHTAGPLVGYDGQLLCHMMVA